MSRNCADFHIIGNVAKVLKMDKVTKVTIAANLRSKKGEAWVDDPHFNTVNIWDKSTRDYIEKDVSTGDLVRVVGRFKESSYDDKRTGDKVYTVDFNANDFSRLAAKQG
jgi:single-strand DNA-binding protein